MKSLFCIFTLLLISQTAIGQWVKQSVNTNASFRGLSVVNDKVIWASGTGGTVIRTVDGGRTWDVNIVPGGEKLDFRDIEAFDADEAYILSIGNGGSSRIYHTTNGGSIWELQFENKDEKAFFDAIACWDRSNCMAMSDPVDNRFVLISTNDGGFHWRPVDTSKMPATVAGEAAFAASGTCLIASGRNNAYLVSGGSDARVFRSRDRGRKWSVSNAPMVNGSAGSGIFSIAMFDAVNGVITGGNYEKPDDHGQSLAFTTDGGRNWRAAAGLTGYRSGVTYIDRKTIIAVGSNGSDISRDGGKSWKALDKENYNAVEAKGKRAVWAVGAKGLVAKFSGK
jgi:photosystem II stability/assembly factor-like uncharacterized protein